MPQRIIIIGDSHTHAIKRSLKLNKFTQDDCVIEAYRLSKIKNGIKVGDISLEEILEQAPNLKKNDMIISVIGGNQHNSFGLIQHPIKFDIFDKSNLSSELSENSECIPYNIISDIFETGLRGNDFARLLQVKSHANCPVYHIGAPPPKESKEHILKRHETDFAAKGILEKGVSSSSLRLKLWHLQMQVTHKLCREAGVNFIAVPDEALCSKGFLKESFYAEDATHANHAYGTLLVENIISLKAKN